MTKTSLALTLSLLAAPALAAEPPKAAPAKPKPLPGWTCTTFNEVDAQFQPKVVYAASTYSKAGKPEGAVVDVAGTEKVIPVIVSDCQKEPKANFLTRLQAAWTKVAADAKAASADLEAKAKKAAADAKVEADKAGAALKEGAQKAETAVKDAAKAVETDASKLGAELEKGLQKAKP